MNKDRHTLFTLQKEIARAVLLGKYIPNKGYTVAKNESGIFKYQISISNKFPQKDTILDMKGNGYGWSIKYMNLRANDWY